MKIKGKEIRNSINIEVLSMMRAIGRVHNVKASQLGMMLKQTSEENISYARRIKFFENYGFIGEAVNSTHRLRTKQWPIIALSGRAGYKYADEKNPTCVEDWTNRLGPKHNETKKLAEGQAKLDRWILQGVIEKAKGKQKMKLLNILQMKGGVSE